MVTGFRLDVATSPYIQGRTDGVRVRIDVGEACGASPKIFAYLMGNLNPVTFEKVGTYSHVCSPSDLEDYPEDEPHPGYIPEFYRLAFVDVIVRSIWEADNFIATVRREVSRLSRTLDIMAETPLSATYFVGSLACLPEDSDSASDSSSDSASDSAGPGTEYLALIPGGDYEHGYGPGAIWVDIGDGAGTPALYSDSPAANGIGAGYSRVVLTCSQSSQLLTVQGYDLSELPEDAELDGLGCRITFRYSPDGDIPPLALLALMHHAVGLSDNRAAEANDLAVVVDAENHVVRIDLDVPGDGTWGAEFTMARVRSGDFGIVLVFAAVAGRETVTIDVDAVELYVRYTSHVSS